MRVRKSGQCKKWLKHACTHIKAMVADVNGPLLEYLAHEIGYDDSECVNLFRTGEFTVASCMLKC